jgi:hypothetical protein
MGSMPARAAITSPIVPPDTCRRRLAGRATISGPGSSTRAPVRAPGRTSMSPSASSSRTASRRVARLTANWSMSFASLGKKSPAFSSPLAIKRRSVRATISAALGAWTPVAVLAVMGDLISAQIQGDRQQLRARRVSHPIAKSSACQSRRCLLLGAPNPLHIRFVR